MKIPVLVYHSINNRKSNLALDVYNFEKQINFLNKEGYETTSINTINKESLMVKGRTTYHSNASWHPT